MARATDTNTRAGRAPARRTRRLSAAAWWAAVAGLVDTSDVAAAEVASQGQIAIETRVFRDDDLAATEDAGAGMFARVEARHAHGGFEEKVRVMGRLDALDRQRSTMIVEEAFAQWKAGRLRLRAGTDIVNWTATEAFHPADVINARNLDSDLENFDKVGEPMVSAQLGFATGTTIAAYAMPVYMNTLFPSPRSRLSFAPAGVDLRERRRLLGRDGRFTDSRFGPQGALRVQQTIGSADVSVHVVHQMDRLQPLVTFDPLALAPVMIFQTVTQAGGTYQQALGSLLVKVEGAYRWFVAPADATVGAGLIGLGGALFPSRDHGAVAIGFEYGVPHEGGPESTLLLEGQAVVGVGESLRRQLNPFQRDVLAGYRLTLGDEASTELVLGCIFDLEEAGEYLVNLSFQRRLGETWSVRAGLRLFQAPDTATAGIAALRKADHVRLSLARHF